MPHAVIENLLILQDRDTKQRSLEAQLAANPAAIAEVEAKIAAERAAIDAAKGELKGLESKKKLLETEIGSAETTLGKYKTQQSLVRKNDEYQALGQQIDQTQKTIESLEEKELELLYSIDEARNRFTAAETVLRNSISGYQAQIATLHERAKNLAAELITARADTQTAREPLPPPALRVYDRVSTRQMPAVVAVRGGKCSGCHLRVSGEAETGARSRDEATLGICDQCGRIIWWES
ncbi:zinc ribbon domain-containing protein [Geminisphaera colitermitum]|uniref:zinc ribbon domain-containing protein n=1 Tax=Geminisphaera colitermitum TaxID=1148786 RepID=UPI0005BAE524|nr:Zn-ribbon protein [Geminisphaera colitermitum]